MNEYDSGYSDELAGNEGFYYFADARPDAPDLFDSSGLIPIDDDDQGPDQPMFETADDMAPGEAQHYLAWLSRQPAESIRPAINLSPESAVSPDRASPEPTFTRDRLSATANSASPFDLPVVPGGVTICSVDYLDIRTAPVKPFTVIHHVPGFAGFNAIESRIADELGLQHRYARKHGLEQEPYLAVCPIGERLIPADFTGRLRDGVALLLPFDLHFMQQQRPHDTRWTTAAEFEAAYTGLTVTYMGKLVTPRGLHGVLHVDTAYYREREPTDWDGIYKRGSITRVVGNKLTEELHEASQIPELQEATYNRLIARVLLGCSAYT